MRYRIVDVFSNRRFAGNALCVVLDKCDEALMPLIAREVNLSETTFPTVTVPGRAYTMRIFVPGAEVPFAGHPSLGTAWVLGAGRWQQTTAGGVVTVEADARGAVMSQPDPAFTEVETDGVAEALGAVAVEGAWLTVVGGTNHVLVPTTARLDTLDPNLEAVARVAHAKTSDAAFCSGCRRPRGSWLGFRGRPGWLARPPPLDNRFRCHHPIRNRNGSAVFDRSACGGRRDPGRRCGHGSCRRTVS